MESPKRNLIRHCFARATHEFNMCVMRLCHPVCKPRLSAVFYFGNLSTIWNLQTSISAIGVHRSFNPHCIYRIFRTSIWMKSIHLVFFNIFIQVHTDCVNVRKVLTCPLHTVLCHILSLGARKNSSMTNSLSSFSCIEFQHVGNAV